MSCTCKYGGGPAGVCGFCRHRAATNERLKKLEDAKASEDFRRGVAAERARVVAWLRAADSETLVWFAAQRIEQGWHDKEGE